MHYLTSLPKSITPDTKCVIMLHGVGSNTDDIFEIKNNFPDEYIKISLQGPFSFGMLKCGWYPVDFSLGKPLYRIQDVNRGFTEIINCIDELVTKFGILNSNIFLLGFSQGAIMAYYTLWKSPERIGGIIGLSGRILDEINLSSIDTTIYSKKRLFVGHGNLDQVIPFSATEKVENYIQSLGVSGELHSYPIGHTISQGEIQDIVEWINL